MPGFWDSWGRAKAEAPVAAAVVTPTAPSEQWEYLRIAVGDEPEMDHLGGQGWELVVIAPEHYVENNLQRYLAPPSYVFKRRLRK